jgi:hypothetical protein
MGEFAVIWEGNPGMRRIPMLVLLGVPVAVTVEHGS